MIRHPRKTALPLRSRAGSLHGRVRTMSNLSVALIAGGVAGALLLTILFKGVKKSNLTSPVLPVWNPQDVPGSLSDLLKFVDGSASVTIDWYWREKGPKARASRIIQALVL